MSLITDFSKFSQKISALVKKNNGYFSHQTALYLMGYLSSVPETITVVSKKRRRNRVIGPFKITFVSRKEIDCSHVHNVLHSENEFIVSSLENTMTDLVENMNYAPNIYELALLFAQLPFSKLNLINGAGLISDTVLKRVSFLLAWSGRARFSDVPFNKFKRTPILLDPREKDSLIWHKLFYCKYPLELLRKPVLIGNFKKSHDAEVMWLNLKANKKFCAFQFEMKTLFIREDISQQKQIDEFFSDWLKELTYKELDIILVDCFNAKGSEDYGKYPILFNKWLRANEEHLIGRHELVEKWVKDNIVSSDIDRVEVAMNLALLLGLDELVISEFGKTGLNLFSAAKFEIIYKISEKYLSSDFILPLSVYLIISKTYTFTEKYEKALKILEEAKKLFSKDGQVLQLGQLHHATGSILMRMHRISESIAEIFMARECFLQANDTLLTARVECTMGTLYVRQGKTDSARSTYKSALALAKIAGNKGLQASLLGNIGIVEYDVGNFVKARYFLFQSYSLHKLMKNHWNASIAQIAVAKIDLRLGRFTKAIKTFRECHEMRVREKNMGGIYETTSLLAWVYEVLGKTAAAKTWWNQARKIPTSKLDDRAFFVGEALIAMTLMFETNFKDALKKYESILEETFKRSASQLQEGDCQHGIAAAKVFLGMDDAVKHIRRAEDCIGKETSRVQLKQVQLIGALYFSNQFPELDIDEIVTSFVETGCYDPFWWLYAEKLVEKRTDATRHYLEYHLKKTPHTTLDICKQRLPELDKIIQSFTSEASLKKKTYVAFMTEGETKPVHIDDYHKWQAKYPFEILVFDGPAGVLAYRGRSKKIKCGTIPHALLSQLFLGYPHVLEIESLYTSAWKMPYDPEYDYGAFKSSLQRLKNYLLEVSCPVEIIRGKTQDQRTGVKLFLPPGWVYVFK